MKKLFNLFVIVLMLTHIVGCSSTEEDPVTTLESITLSQSELSMAVGDKYTLTVTTNPQTVEGLQLVWTSTDPEVADVDPNGQVTANKAGETVIKVSCGAVSATCTVKVSEGVESLEVTPSVAEIEAGETVTLTATVLPAGADAEVVWKSSNVDVATVDENGVVTGVAPGNVIIMAEAGGITDDCMVSVVSVPVESISLDESDITIDEGQSWTLHATVMPESADNKSIVWESSDENVAQVSGSGTVVGKRGGEAVITAKAGNKTAQCHVTVKTLPLAVGNFYYSDGTWSSQLDGGKTPIGVVFYVGDMTKYDPALKREHPECTHGLVVALQETSSGITWQNNYAAYGNTVGSWIDENVSDYETILSGFELTDHLNIPYGYNNTKAIEAFNAAPENAEWPVEAVQYVVSYRETVKAPASTSDWYLGSAKEMNMLACGDYDGNIWDIRDAGASAKNLKTVNESIAQVQDAVQIGKALLTGLMFYWTSTEVSAEMSILMTTTNGQMPMTYKNDGYAIFRARAILAF